MRFSTLLVFTSLLTLPLAGHAAVAVAPPTTEPPYLLLGLDFRLDELNVLGRYPRLRGQEYLERLARPPMEAAIDEFTGGNLVSLDEIDHSGIAEWNQVLGIFDRMSLLPLSYLDPEEPSEFFAGREPDLAIGPLLADLEYKGRPVDRAIKVEVIQLIIDRQKMSEFAHWVSNRSSLIKACTFDLNKGELIWCAYRQEDANLFDRHGVWRKDHYAAEVEALFNDPASTFYRRESK